MKRINKEAFLKTINGGFDFYEFVINELQQIDKMKCKKCLNPFYDDSVPSLSIYRDDKTDKWLFYDHGDSPTGIKYKGDVFDFAGHYYRRNVKENFQEILTSMAGDLKVELEVTDYSSEYCLPDELVDYYNGPEQDYKAWLLGFELLYKGADRGIKEAHTYFNQFGITEEILRQYNVRAISQYKCLNKENVVITHFLSKKQTVIAYSDIQFAKLYRPNPKAFWYVGSKPSNYIFGLNEIYRRIRIKKACPDTIFITGGEKDVLTLTSLGFDAVCFNSETAAIPYVAVEDLFPIYKNIIVIYDNDETGIKQSEVIANKLRTKFSISIYHLPQELKEVGGKDISDYVKYGLDIEKLKKDICTTSSETAVITGNDTSQLDRGIPLVPSLINPQETSFLPNSVYQDIPEILKIICNQFTDPRDRDLVCLSAITVMSSFFPKVKGIYDGANVGCNLYLFVSAPASAGKGVMTWGRKLGGKIQKHLLEKYTNDLVRYEAELLIYEMRKSDNPHVQKPPPPERQSMFIPANSSVSKVIQFLGANRDFGIIFETEGDVLTNTLNNEWGDFSTVLRQAFHHETISLSRRAKDEFIEIDGGHLSVLLTGTPNQANGLFKSVENGFFSRFIYYEFSPEVKWKNKFGCKETCLEDAFNELADIMLQYWKLQEVSSITKIYMSPPQVSQINAYFENKLRDFYSEFGDPIAANVKRACLVFYRMAMIFAILRWLEENEKMPVELEISDADFNCAFAIVDTLFYHLQKVYFRIENAANTAKLNMKQKMLFEALPTEFTRASYDSIAESLKIKYKTAERHLGKFISNELIERYEQGKYRRA